jgi:hypothetical protein
LQPSAARGDGRPAATALEQEFGEEHKSEDLLVSLLRTLIWTRWGWEQMELKLTGVTLHVTLGVPPKLSAEIH